MSNILLYQSQSSSTFTSSAKHATNSKKVDPTKQIRETLATHAEKWCLLTSVVLLIDPEFKKRNIHKYVYKPFLRNTYYVHLSTCDKPLHCNGLDILIFPDQMQKILRKKLQVFKALDTHTTRQFSLSAAITKWAIDFKLSTSCTFSTAAATTHACHALPVISESLDVCNRRTRLGIVGHYGCYSQ